MTNTTDVPGPAWGLIGVALGWVLNALMDAIRRRWQRKDKTRDLSIQRGEDLLQHCHEAFQWSEDARKKAFEGDVYVPIQTPVFRIAGAVELFYPVLSERAKDLDRVARDYRSTLVDIASGKARGTPLTQEANHRLQATLGALQLSIGVLLTEARAIVRATIG